MHTNDGLELLGKTPKEVVRELRASSHAPGNGETDFMQLLASRVALQTGKRVRSGSAEEFIEDLMAAGFLLEDDGAEFWGDPTTQSGADAKRRNLSVSGGGRVPARLLWP